MTVDLSQFVNQTVDVVYRKGNVRRNVVIHYVGPEFATYPYMVKGHTYTKQGSSSLSLNSDLDIVSIHWFYHFYLFPSNQK